MKYTPLQLSRGNDLILLSIKEYNITFLDSYKYLYAPLSQIKLLPTVAAAVAAQHKGVFPHGFNCPKNWNTILSKPPDLKKYFLTPNDDESAILEKTFYVTNWPPGKSWNFNDCILKYCHQDVQILLAAVIGMLQQSFSFQKLLSEHFGPPIQASAKRMSYSHWLSQPLCTLSSAR